MFVIFPAEELILMTYGAAIPRISPRPTLDCLREPQVPIVIPARSLPPPSTFAALPTPTSPAKASSRNISQVATFEQQQLQQLSLEQNEFEDYPIYQPESITPPRHFLNSAYERTLLPTISERPTPSTTPIPFTTPTSTPPLIPSRRESRTSLKRSTPVQRTPLEQRRFNEQPSYNIQQQQSLVTSKPPTPPQLRTSMYNDLNMRSSQQQQPQASPSSSSASRANLQRSSAIRDTNPLGYYEDPAMGSSRYPPIDYPTGSSRERSPSIFIDPPTPDPTQPRLGPGWGRPMSPMELPPEPSTSHKASTSKSRFVRPRLHIPLGKLGRSSSSDQKESQRLREDLELRVENPIFNTENVVQRNFDAFFDSGEPVYKLQPKSPASAPADGSAVTYIPHLDKYAGVYDSGGKNRNPTGGGLFARSTKEDKLLSSRSKSAEHYDPVRDGRASSVGPAAGSASVASGGSGGGGGGGGVPQKGDRCPKNTFLHKSNKIVYSLTA